MHKPRSSKLVYAFFSWFIGFLVKKDFKRFAFNDVDLNKDKAILLMSNHFSWWDAFLLFYLNKIYLKRNFYIMVSEENYRKIWFIKYLGAFSVKTNSKSVIETLAYAGTLLNNPNNLVVVFPQGKLYSSHVEEIKFERGIWKLIDFSNKSFQYLFVSVFVDYFEFRRPSVSCYLQISAALDYSSVELVGKAFNDHYQTSRQQQNRTTV